MFNAKFVASAVGSDIIYQAMDETRLGLLNAYLSNDTARLKELSDRLDKLDALQLQAVGLECEEPPSQN